MTGDAPGLGEPVGEGVGDVTGLAAGATVGVAVGVFTGSGLLSQALNAATLAARKVDIINDLLIVFLLDKLEYADKRPSAAQTSTAGLI